MSCSRVVIKCEIYDIPVALWGQRFALGLEYEFVMPKIKNREREKIGISIFRIFIFTVRWWICAGVRDGILKLYIIYFKEFWMWKKKAMTSFRKVTVQDGEHGSQKKSSREKEFSVS